MSLLLTCRTQYSEMGVSLQEGVVWPEKIELTCNSTHAILLDSLTRRDISWINRLELRCGHGGVQLG